MKWILRLFGLLIVVALVFVASVLLLPGDRIAQVAVDQLRAQTGREVTLKGESTVSFYPVLGISTGALEIANADWSDTGPFMVADSLKVGVDLVSLIQGEINITGLEAIGPVLLLEKAADGRSNWDIGVSGVTPSGQQSARRNPLALTLDRAVMTGGQMRFLDHESGTDLVLDDLALDLRWPEYHGGAVFDVSGRLQGASLVTMSGEISNLADLIEGGLTQGTFLARTKGGSAEFTGHIGFPVEATGDLSVNLTDTATVLSALGSGRVDLPDGLGRKVSVNTEMTLTQQQKLTLRDMRVTLDNNAFSGDVDFDMAPDVPALSARLSAGRLDFLPAQDSSGKGGAKVGGWSKAPIDASVLGRFNGQVSLDAQELHVAGLQFGAASLRARIDNARAVIDMPLLQGYSGTVVGQVVANNRNGLSVGGSVQASGIEMQPFLTDLVGIRRFTGQGEATIDFLGSGNSMDAIMNSLSGEGGVALGRGTIEGIDLDSLMREGLPTGGTTVFDSLAATFTMAGGDLFNNDLLLKLPVLSASGEGRVGLGARDIDYLFTPRTASAEVEGGLLIPVRIRGPWSNPQYYPDLEKAIDLNLKKEKDAAKQKVEEKVKEKLNLGTEEGKSLEDSAKEKLEEELKKGLGRLLK